MPQNYEGAWENLELNLKTNLPLKDVWNKVVDYHSDLNPNAYWQTIKGLDVGVDQESLKQWMEQLIINNPLPKDVAALWIGISKFWDEENEKEVYGIYLTGSDTYSPDDAEWALEPVYDPENKYIMPDMLSLVDDVIIKDEENYSFLDWILPLAYTSLAINDIIKNSFNRSLFLKDNSSVFVTVGFDGGDFIEIQPIS